MMTIKFFKTHLVVSKIPKLPLGFLGSVTKEYVWETIIDVTAGYCTEVKIFYDGVGVEGKTVKAAVPC